MKDARIIPANIHTHDPTPAEEAEAERLADVHSGRAFEWHVGQDAYERWLDEVAP